MQHLKSLIESNPLILNAYEYGSFVYNTNHEQSDRDYILVVQNDCYISDFDYLSKHGDFNIFKLSEFENMIRDQEITSLECLFLHEDHILKQEIKFKYEKDIPKLRIAISSKSSNSWVKAKKKFVVEKDYAPYIGQKSAWHALRIIDFGTQIATHGKIIKFDSVNHFLADILKCNSWDEIDNQFRSTYNSMSSQFKQVAPKEIIMPVKIKP